MKISSVRIEKFRSFEDTNNTFERLCLFGWS